METTSSFKWTGHNTKEVKQWLKQLVGSITVNSSFPSTPKLEIWDEDDRLIFVVETNEYIVKHGYSIEKTAYPVGHIHDSDLAIAPILDKDRSIATILAALRFMQANMDDDILEMDHFEDIECLSDTEIDQLCQEINYGSLEFKEYYNGK